ncbi:hypothetical protein FQA39_LY16379 [Lamprigera yunnana]|nr:hypothetical protein FQA39_LY16379 [Lamprigera yunnana]
MGFTLGSTEPRIQQLSGMDLTSPILNQCEVTINGIGGQAYVAFVNTILAAQCALYTPEIYPPNYGPQLKDDDEFDFIVAGAGSAGSILTNRLSENPEWKVLLLEAGDYPTTTTEIPNLFFTMAHTKEDWGYMIEPSETACLGLNDGLCGCPRGKVLGGSSNLNAMLYIRGNRKDFDRWADAGNEGWNYDSVLKHFKIFEDFEEGDGEILGKGGELKITQYINDDHPVRETLQKAYEEVGYGQYSDERPQGYLNMHMTIHNGTRQSTAKAFLTKIKGRKNVRVAVNAHVTKVLLDSNLRVEGVLVRINDKIIKIKATKEVILSAGSVNSPQILMNSGIGPKEHLKKLDIPVLRDLRVGENLQDHLLFTGLMMNVASDAIQNKTLKSVMDDWYKYFVHQKGILSNSGIENLIFFFNSKNHSIYPTLEMYYSFIYQNDPYNILKVQNENIKKSHNIILIPGLTYPASVGKVLLRSADPFDKPKIFTNYFSDKNDEDIITMLEGVRFFQKVVKTKAFAQMQPKLVHMDLVNCRSFVPDSDDYWKCAIRNMATTIYHLSGTAKMGPEEDPTAVVDQRLRVHGVKGLRVVDASIIPKLISCNINAATIMIGQKASEMIKEDWAAKPHIEL